MKAAFFETLDNNNVQCNLCPHQCIIRDGKHGICRIRFNKEGELIAETFRKYSAVSFDPIEKKPLYHFFPGKEILSLGSVGCNMSCKWCQNCEISQTGVHESRELVHLTPDRIVEMTQNKPHNIGAAYTYNEPSVSYESIIETAQLIKDAGLQNVMVTNGYIGSKALNSYLTVIDAFNVDIKAYDEKIHQKYTGAKLYPVLENIKAIKNSGKHIELTYMLVPGINDDISRFEDLLLWISNNLGKGTVMHISRYFPRHQMNTGATKPELLELFASLAQEKLTYIYTGNYSSDQYQNTHCPSCNHIVIYRSGYHIDLTGDISDGRCPNCGESIFTVH